MDPSSRGLLRGPEDEPSLESEGLPVRHRWFLVISGVMGICMACLILSPRLIHRTFVHDEEAIAMAHSDQLKGMMLFQFNPHWECFKPQNAEGCGRQAMALVTELLQRHNVDLANVVELPESYKPPKGWSMNCRPGGGGDTTCIIWRSNKWEVIGPSTECWFGRGRSCNVMTFEHVATKFKVSLAGAHFPHGAGTSWYSEFLGILGMNLHKSKNVTEKVIILADSNAGLHQKSDFSILTETGVLLPHVKAPQMWYSYRTCCNNIGYHGFFDRIIANFGSKLELVKDEVYEKQSNGYKSTPAFARVNLPKSGTWGHGLVECFQL